MSKVIFQIEGGTPVSITCNTGDNLLEAARRPMWQLTLLAPVMAPAANVGSGSWRVTWTASNPGTSPTRNGQKAGA